MAAPCSLIASCSVLEPEELVKQILGTPELPDGTPIVENVRAYHWHIDTKYYTANIQLCTTPERTIGDKEFADHVQAFVLHFDTTLESSFKGVELWLPYVKELKPIVQLLVCNTCSDGDAISKTAAWTWCLENNFELIELHPDQDSGSEEDDFMETTGIKRVVEALHAHTWPNLLMKEKPSFRSPYMQQMMATEAASNAAANQDPEPESAAHPNAEAGSASSQSETRREQDSLPEVEGASAPAEYSVPDPVGAAAVGAMSSLPSSDSCRECGLATVEAIKATKQLENAAKKQSASNSGQLRMASSPLEGGLSNEDLELFTALGNEDPGGESFEQLFERLRLMKERAEALPLEQRKTLAEQVAVQFWKAVGGEDDEIEGLSSDDD